MGKERDGFRVENEKAVGPNVISFELITGDDEGKEERWYVVGCYLPPSDKRGRHSDCRRPPSRGPPRPRGRSPSSSAT